MPCDGCLPSWDALVPTAQGPKNGGWVNQGPGREGDASDLCKERIVGHKDGEAFDVTDDMIKRSIGNCDSVVHGGKTNILVGQSVCARRATCPS